MRIAKNEQFIYIPDKAMNIPEKEKHERILGNAILGQEYF